MWEIGKKEDYSNGLQAYLWLNFQQKWNAILIVSDLLKTSAKQLGKCFFNMRATFIWGPVSQHSGSICISLCDMD